MEDLKQSQSGEPKDPIDAYDSAHGTQDNGIPKVSEDQAWGGGLNPVRETPAPYKNLRQV